MPSKVDIKGKRFGRLVVVSESEKRTAHGNVYWNCVCDCGKDHTAQGKLLRNGEINSCGCGQKEYYDKDHYKDITGQKFGRLTALKFLRVNKLRRAVWLCSCECGKEHETEHQSLAQGRTKSCGCLNVDTDKRRDDLKGIVLGQYKAIRYVETRKSPRSNGKVLLEAVWEWECTKCGERVLSAARNKKHHLHESCIGHMRSESKEYKSAMQGMRSRRARKSTPKWISKQEINAVYQKRKLGEHVDHIVPLKNDIVCGLNVPWNLRIITAKENLTKHNRFIEELAYA